jgi:hypothetical protein
MNWALPSWALGQLCLEADRGIRVYKPEELTGNDIEELKKE